MIKVSRVEGMSKFRGPEVEARYAQGTERKPVCLELRDQGGDIRRGGQGGQGWVWVVKS